MRNNNLAIFDFCDTIVHFQSADAFTNFVLQRQGGMRSVLLNAINKTFSTFRIYSIFDKLGVFKNLQKKMLLSGLKDIPFNRLADFAKDFEKNVVQGNLNVEVVTLLNKHISDGDEVILNSGGYELYLTFFAKRMGINKTYATQIEFIDGKCTGKILGIDCLHNEKVSRMKNDGFNFQSFKEISVYSDSVTDMPLFDIATQKIAVIKGEVVPQWCNNNLFQILKV